MSSINVWLQAADPRSDPEQVESYEDTNDIWPLGEWPIRCRPCTDLMQGLLAPIAKRLD